MNPRYEPVDLTKHTKDSGTSIDTAKLWLYLPRKLTIFLPKSTEPGPAVKAVGPARARAKYPGEVHACSERRSHGLDDVRITPQLPKR